MTPTDDQPVLLARGLGAMRGERLLFDALDVAISSSQMLEVGGRNGSGKTTLLRILCGLTLPSGGEIHWRGQDIYADAASYREELLYVGHANGVNRALSATENLRFSRSMRRQNTAASIAQVLDRMNLASVAEVPARALSAGQSRRLALCRLLLNRAVLWVLDEPLTALDQAGRNTVEELIGEHLDDGGLVIATSHQSLHLGGRDRVRLDISP